MFPTKGYFTPFTPSPRTGHSVVYKGLSFAGEQSSGLTFSSLSSILQLATAARINLG
jgi:hypothetical protein